MACATCDHTMQGIRHHVFWCPRCGTIKLENTATGHHDIEAPKVVAAARQVVQHFDNNKDAHHLTRTTTSGLADALTPPDMKQANSRPQSSRNRP